MNCANLRNSFGLGFVIIWYCDCKGQSLDSYSSLFTLYMSYLFMIATNRHLRWILLFSYFFLVSGGASQFMHNFVTLLNTDNCHKTLANKAF